MLPSYPLSSLRMFSVSWSGVEVLPPMTWHQIAPRWSLWMTSVMARRYATSLSVVPLGAAS